MKNNNFETNSKKYFELYDLHSMGVLDPKKYELQVDQTFVKEPRLMNVCAIIDEAQDKWVPSGFRIFVKGNGDGSYRLTLVRPNALGTGGEIVIDLKAVPFGLVAATTKDLWSAQTRLPLKDLPADRAKMQLDPRVVKESQWVLGRFLKGMSQMGTTVMGVSEDSMAEKREDKDFDPKPTVQKATNLLQKFIHRKDRK